MTAGPTLKVMKRDSWQAYCAKLQFLTNLLLAPVSLDERPPARRETAGSEVRKRGVVWRLLFAFLLRALISFTNDSHRLFT
jgi:hypothetical protein